MVGEVGVGGSWGPKKVSEWANKWGGLTPLGRWTESSRISLKNRIIPASGRTSGPANPPLNTPPNNPPNNPPANPPTSQTNNPPNNPPANPPQSQTQVGGLPWGGTKRKMTQQDREQAATTTNSITWSTRDSNDKAEKTDNPYQRGRSGGYLSKHSLRPKKI